MQNPHRVLRDQGQDPDCEESNRNKFQHWISSDSKGFQFSHSLGVLLVGALGVWAGCRIKVLPVDIIMPALTLIGCGFISEPEILRDTLSRPAENDLKSAKHFEKMPHATGKPVGSPHQYDVKFAAVSSGEQLVERRTLCLCTAYGIGNPYLGLTYSAKGAALDFSTSLNTAIPTASTAKGLSTGHVTVDWSNHLAHEFDLFTPFVDVGLANSIPDTRFLHRPYISYGDVAHLEGGSELDLGDKFSATASGYYILPWGAQQIFLRGKKSSPGPMKGSVSLTRDDGINLGVDYNLTRSLDLSAGYSRSVYSVLNTFSFGIGMNVSSLLKGPSKD